MVHRLEMFGLTLNLKKIEDLTPDVNEHGSFKIDGTEILRTSVFEYLGSATACDGILTPSLPGTGSGNMATLQKRSERRDDARQALQKKKNHTRWTAVLPCQVVCLVSFKNW